MAFVVRPINGYWRNEEERNEEKEVKTLRHRYKRELCADVEIDVWWCRRKIYVDEGGHV